MDFIIAVNREHVDLERKYQQLLRQNGTLQVQVQEKAERLEKMRIGKAWLIFLSLPPAAPRGYNCILYIFFFDEPGAVVFKVFPYVVNLLQ